LQGHRVKVKVAVPIKVTEGLGLPNGAKNDVGNCIA